MGSQAENCLWKWSWFSSLNGRFAFEMVNSQVIGAGDFNEDGKTDLVWEHQPTGGVYVWLMNGVTYSNDAGLLYYSSDLDWEIEAP